MFDKIENLKPVSVIRGVASISRIYENRETHALIFKLNGTTRYDINGKTIYHNQNELLFIPKGESYKVELVSEPPSYYLLINFNAHIPFACSHKFNLGNVTDVSFLLGRIDKLRTNTNKLKCLSVIYEILALAKESEHTAYIRDESYLLINPAVKYLEEHIFDSTLKIGELHKKTPVSDTYFRRIFIARFGVSPKRFVTNKRLTQAKAIIDNGEFNSIGEVARLCGFEDPLYFSKIYKNTYGVPPSKQ